MLSSQALKFALVGASNFVLELILFNAIQSPTHHTLFAKILSAVIAMILSYLANHYWVFKAQSHHRKQVVSFFTLNTVLILVSALTLQVCIWTGIVTVLTHLMNRSMSLNIVNIASIGCTMLLRYWLYKHHVFVQDEESLIVPA